MFKNIKKQKELIDRELEIYRKEKLVEITLDIAQEQEKGAKQEREYECEWHQKRQDLLVEIAELEAKKESYVSHLEKKLENYVCEYQAVNRAKDKTIEVLEQTIKGLISKIEGSKSNIEIIK